MYMHRSYSLHSNNNSTQNQYPFWLALLVAIVVLIATAGIASTFPTYGSGNPSFDANGMKNFGSGLKSIFTWFVGGSLAVASLMAGLMEAIRVQIAAKTEAEKESSPQP